MRVVKPLLTVEPWLPRAIARILEYDAKIGIDGTVLYARDKTIGRLERAPELAPLVASGQLRIVRWGLEVPVTDGWDTYDQPAINNHAILSAWGARTLLWLADLDEIFALPRGARLPDLVREGGCLAEVLRSGCAHIAGVPAYRREVVMDSGSLSEGMSDASSERAATMQSGSERIALGASLYEALGNYTLLDVARSWSKSLVDPTNTVGFKVHSGFVCEGEDDDGDKSGGLTAAAGSGAGRDGRSVVGSHCQVVRECPGVPKTCAMFMHLLNFHKHRFEVPSRSVQTDEWTWVLKE